MSSPATIVHSFLEENERVKRDSNEDENLAVRFCRKKFKCILIVCLTLCIFCEASILMMNKFELENLGTLKKVFSSFLNGTSTDWSSPYP